MGTINEFENKGSVAWRNAKGEIECDKVKCAKERCDERCPISVCDVGGGFLKIGDSDAAMKWFKKAVAIAPDYKKAWNNMGGILGQRGEYTEAHECYKKAYEIDPYYRNALFGLIMTARDLGRFEEALDYCDEYAQKIDASEAARFSAMVREKVWEKEARQKTITTSDIDIALKMIEMSKSLGLLESLPADRFPNIPELIVRRKEVCEDILRDMFEQKDDPDCKNPMVWLGWATYAGIGAVWHWNKDWDSLKEKGIFATLCEPRGSFYMDEYVMDSVGKKYDSKEEIELRQAITDINSYAMSQIMIDSGNFNISPSIPDIFEAMKAAYIWGMVYQMYEMGMR